MQIINSKYIGYKKSYKYKKKYLSIYVLFSILIYKNQVDKKIRCIKN